MAKGSYIWQILKPNLSPTQQYRDLEKKQKTKTKRCGTYINSIL